MERKETKRAAREDRRKQETGSKGATTTGYSVKREGAISDEDIASKRTAHGGALCRRGTGAGGDAVGGVGYVLAHVRNCSHLSRKREAKEAKEAKEEVEEAGLADGEG